MNNRIVLGILAHVDAGKTTLSEAILYTTGTIRKIGRVDNKDTFLSYTVFASSTGVKYYGSTPKSLQYKEFYNFDKQYEFLKETKKSLS